MLKYGGVLKYRLKHMLSIDLTKLSIDLAKLSICYIVESGPVRLATCSMKFLCTRQTVRTVACRGAPRPKKVGVPRWIKYFSHPEFGWKEGTREGG